jgi:3-oxoacyl-[acyl-carrier protein] reductase
VNISLKGSVSIVTGGSKGIGKAIALALAKAGSDVVVTSRSQKELDAVAKEVESHGVQCLPIAGDVSKKTDVDRVISRTIGAFGTVDVLVNNAGIGKFGKVVDMSEEDFERMLSVNLLGVFLFSKAVLPTMIQKKKGSIINISSLAGKNSFVGGAGYSASKWGLMGFAKSLMLEVRNSNIRVVTICPGSVDTKFSTHPKDLEKLIQPEDVAETVLFAITMPARSNVSEIDIRPTIPPA